jgi:hypothetical protein
MTTRNAKLSRHWIKLHMALTRYLFEKPLLPCVATVQHPRGGNNVAKEFDKGEVHKGHIPKMTTVQNWQLSHTGNLPSFNILKPQSYSSFVAFQSLDFSHCCHIWAKVFQTFLCQRLHCHILQEGVQRHPAVHPCIPIRWKDMVRPACIISHALWRPLP